MIVHIRHERGLNHAITQMPDDGPLILTSWSTNAPRATTTRAVNEDEIRTIVGHWREMHARGDLEVVTVDWPKLKLIAPLEAAEA